MRRIKVWFAAFGLAGMLSAGAAGQAFAAPVETEAAAVTETAAEPAADAAAAETEETAAAGNDAAETSETEEASQAAEKESGAGETAEADSTVAGTSEENVSAPAEAAETSGAEAAADAAGTPAEAEQGTELSEEALRENIVDYALSFVGGRYVWGGNDPHTGADCSGFVRYILSNTAGVSMSRTSADQAREGVTVSAEEMQPGDLLFYGKGSRVNHVAMYIGDGQIVHASTSKTGIKVSQWNYRNPIRIASFVG